ncbi:hypothetical protein GRZ55_11350 [Chelativorans sp. ZYF759]|uniref:hypothetical protein n=1 Tax=Chelativorans sp. ZYF759 TaxID=2692213 RepID=UPI00145F57FD|nr:hypothetical protein [Chelativorans sp. ZYF759]NMG39840.1 hypothetical protein [Chelativorans sp. ZYF759]
MMDVNLSALWARLADRYEFGSRWHNLSALGTSPAVRVSVLMPVAGYLLLLNEQFVELAGQISEDFQLIITDVPWRLLLLFYGSFLVGFATILFGMFCPYVPKRYRSAVDFVAHEQTFFTISSHKTYLIETFEEIYEPLPGGLKKDHVLQGANRIRSVSEIEQLTLYWHVRNMQSPAWRRAIRILYDVGFFILAIPAAATLAGVTWYVVKLIYRMIV